MYILTPGFQGFTKHSRSSELFGAQNCNTFGHFSSQFSGICISKLLRMESASQPTGGSWRLLSLHFGSLRWSSETRSFRAEVMALNRLSHGSLTVFLSKQIDLSKSAIQRFRKTLARGSPSSMPRRLCVSLSLRP